MDNALSFSKQNHYNSLHFHFAGNNSTTTLIAVFLLRIEMNHGG